MSSEQYIELDATETATVPVETYNAVVQQCEVLKLRLEIAELREQVASRDIAITERDRLLDELREQGGSAAVAELRERYNVALKRAQLAEAALATADSRQRAAESAADGFREQNKRLSKREAEFKAYIRQLEVEVATSEGEFDSLRQAQAGGGA